LANLRMPEVTRALRAVSSAYVQRRGRAIGATLDGAGKRAAFALFYAPLHFLITDFVVRDLGAHMPAPRTILDIGCGTGAAGAAWSVESDGVPVTGTDRHPWAIEEARWTYRHFGLNGRTRLADVTRLPPLRPGTAVVAAFVLNELPERQRERFEQQLIEAAGRGVRILVIEPIARSITPWWERSAARFIHAGGRADEWRFPIDLPPQLRQLDKAAGLDHRELTARSLYCPADSGYALAGADGRPKEDP
jgi:hypothetical protein